MQYLFAQSGATVVFTLLRWTFIWTNSAKDNSSWFIVNNLFYVVALSWLFTLGYFVKSKMEENLKERIADLEKSYRRMNYDHEEDKKVFAGKLKTLGSEKERFLVIIENMVRNVGMKEVEFHLSKSDREIADKERSIISNFVGG